MELDRKQIRSGNWQVLVETGKKPVESDREWDKGWKLASVGGIQQ